MPPSPPYYVLLSHSTLATSPNSTVNPPPALAHPTVQYQYRDDPPLPPANSQHVLVMDYDSASPEDVQVQSLSPHIAVTSLKVTDAPGTASIGQDEEPKNTKMYVLETVSHQASDKSSEKNIEDIPSVVSLTSFKQRNALLRKALEYPLPSASLPTPISAPIAPSPSPRPSPHRAAAPLPPASPVA